MIEMQDRETMRRLKLSVYTRPLDELFAETEPIVRKHPHICAGYWGMAKIEQKNGNESRARLWLAECYSAFLFY